MTRDGLDIGLQGKRLLADIQARRQADDLPDTLLLLEHSPAKGCIYIGLQQQCLIKLSPQHL